MVCVYTGFPPFYLFWFMIVKDLFYRNKAGTLYNLKMKMSVLFYTTMLDYAAFNITSFICVFVVFFGLKCSMIVLLLIHCYIAYGTGQKQVPQIKYKQAKIGIKKTPKTIRPKINFKYKKVTYHTHSHMWVWVWVCVSMCSYAL